MRFWKKTLHILTGVFISTFSYPSEKCTKKVLNVLISQSLKKKEERKDANMLFNYVLPGSSEPFYNVIDSALPI